MQLFVVAAERVVEKGVHKFSGKTFHLQFPVVKKLRRVDIEKDDGSCSISNSDCGNVVEIYGDIEGLWEQFLEMYLESTRRSGGGEIETLKLNANPPCVVFRDCKGKCCDIACPMERIN